MVKYRCTHTTHSEQPLNTVEFNCTTYNLLYYKHLLVRGQNAKSEIKNCYCINNNGDKKNGPVKTSVCKRKLTVAEEVLDILRMADRLLGVPSIR